MKDLSLEKIAALIGPHLPGIACLTLLVRGERGWQVAESRIFAGQAGAPQPPDDSVLDFAALAGRPTYLPQGEETSDFCLLDARSTVYFPLEGGRKLLYVVGAAPEVFSLGGVEAAWRALGGPPGGLPGDRGT